MEVHHHSHTSRKKWTHYFWEFLMLFLAVFCGFLAEYQLEHKIEKDRSKEYAKALYNDLVSDTAYLDSLVQATKRNIPYIDTLVDLFQKMHIEKTKVPGATLYYFRIKAISGTAFNVRTANLKQIINSGSLRLLKNKELIDLVAAYDRSVTGTIEFAESRRTQAEDLTNYANRIFNYFETIKLNKLLSEYPAKTDSVLSLDFPLLNNDDKSFSDFLYVLGSRKATLQARGNKFYGELLRLAKQLIEILKKGYHMK